MSPLNTSKVLVCDLSLSLSLSLLPPPLSPGKADIRHYCKLGQHSFSCNWNILPSNMGLQCPKKQMKLCVIKSDYNTITTIILTIIIIIIIIIITTISIFHSLAFQYKSVLSVHRFVKSAVQMHKPFCTSLCVKIVLYKDSFAPC